MRRITFPTGKAVARHGSNTVDVLGFAGLTLLTVVVAAACLFVLLWVLPELGIYLAIAAWVAVLGLAIGIPVLLVQIIGEAMD
ncbi:hypothetical protein [Haloarchaeobius sp. DFWS5]|uniref:hypothetical protein n=1 Tax=Haloarchaeobius sp. DFWS5 TaxID=3446114 RepID=UPI003EBF34FA